MNSGLSLTDYASLSPLLILLAAALGLLLLESFSVKWAKKASFPLALAALSARPGSSLCSP